MKGRMRTEGCGRRDEGKTGSVHPSSFRPHPSSFDYPRYGVGHGQLYVTRTGVSVNIEAEQRRNRYSATKDGQRFLVILRAPTAVETALAVQSNWLTAFKP